MALTFLSPQVHSVLVRLASVIIIHLEDSLSVQLSVVSPRKVEKIRLHLL